MLKPRFDVTRCKRCKRKPPLHRAGVRLFVGAGWTEEAQMKIKRPISILLGFVLLACMEAV
ncbi:MAG: hypothetical protein WBO23_18585, partial [Burkholderiales bacterium]